MAYCIGTMCHTTPGGWGNRPKCAGQSALRHWTDWLCTCGSCNTYVLIQYQLLLCTTEGMGTKGPKDTEEHVIRAAVRVSPPSTTLRHRLWCEAGQEKICGRLSIVMRAGALGRHSNGNRTAKEQLGSSWQKVKLPESFTETVHQQKHRDARRSSGVGRQCRARGESTNH